MNIEEDLKIKHRNSKNSEPSKINYLKNLVTRTLLSVIFVMIISIFLKLDNGNEELVKKQLFENSLKFTELNNLTKKYAGNLIPKVEEPTTLVFSSSDLAKYEYEKYQSGVKILTNKSEPISALYGGIVVFIGTKDDYENTIIIQGNDGLDYWYGGITNLTVNLYDYIEKDTLIGETKNKYLYLVLQKDGKYINYEEIL